MCRPTEQEECGMPGGVQEAAADVPAFDGARVPLSLDSAIDTLGPRQQQPAPPTANEQHLQLQQHQTQHHPQQLPQHQQSPPAPSAAEDAAAAAQRKAFEPYHSKSVPKSEKLTAQSKQGAVTTVMLRNIPNKYSQSTLLGEIDDMGFEGTYDFFYLPMDVQNRSNVGYAFIDFVLPDYAQRFLSVFKEHRFRKHQSRKISSVSTAHVQGLDANLRHFENRAVTHSRNDQYRPVVIMDNKRVDFDEAVAAAVARDPAKQQQPKPPAQSAAPGQIPQLVGGPLEPGAAGLKAARCDLEGALQEYLRQASATSSTASSGGSAAVAPPPGLVDVEVSLGWSRQTSAPPASRGAGRASSGSDGCQTPELEGPRGPSIPSRRQRRSHSLSGEPGRMPAEESPIYLPLPTIPSASKIFAGCHLEDDPDFNLNAQPTSADFGMHANFEGPPAGMTPGRA